MIDKKIIAIRRIVKQGGSFAITIPKRYCRREKIVIGEHMVIMDRGSRLTVTSMKQFEFDESLKRTLTKKEGEI